MIIIPVHLSIIKTIEIVIPGIIEIRRVDNSFRLEMGNTFLDNIVVSDTSHIIAICSCSEDRLSACSMAMIFDAIILLWFWSVISFSNIINIFHVLLCWVFRALSK